MLKFNFSKFLISIIMYFLLIHIVSSDQVFVENILKFKLNTNNNILHYFVGEDMIFKGNIKGKISSSSKGFQRSSISCDLLGRSYKGRGFSCGFSEVEDLTGYCYLSFPDNLDLILTKWDCSTTAGFDGDAICAGKVDIISGEGKFVGIIGFGKIEIPLAKTLEKNDNNYPIKLNIKIKYPLTLKKN